MLGLYNAVLGPGGLLGRPPATGAPGGQFPWGQQWGQWGQQDFPPHWGPPHGGGHWGHHGGHWGHGGHGGHGGHHHWPHHGGHHWHHHGGFGGGSPHFGPRPPFGGFR